MTEALSCFRANPLPRRCTFSYSDCFSNRHLHALTSLLSAKKNKWKLEVNKHDSLKKYVLSEPHGLGRTYWKMRAGEYHSLVADDGPGQKSQNGMNCPLKIELMRRDEGIWKFKLDKVMRVLPIFNDKILEIRKHFISGQIIKQTKHVDWSVQSKLNR